jgi:hypothetical protein
LSEPTLHHFPGDLGGSGIPKSILDVDIVYLEKADNKFPERFCGQYCGVQDTHACHYVSHSGSFVLHSYPQQSCVMEKQIIRRGIAAPHT